MILCSVAACGRLGFEPRVEAAVDAPNDPSDAPDDAPPTASKVYTITGNGVQPTELFEVDLASGQLTKVGEVAASFGTLTGLAYWDANTLYATGSQFVEIKLSPFSAQSLVAPSGAFSALERVGARLTGVDEVTDRLVSWTPGSTLATIAPAPLGPAAQGGDLTQTSDGTWYWFTNPSEQLYTLDVVTGVATAVGSPATGAPFFTGLVHDAADQLYGVTSGLVPVDKVTGQLGTPINVCITCPTSFPLGSGDSTQTP